METKGLCGGFAIIGSDLCNQIGIPSYVVVGTIDVNGETINHGLIYKQKNLERNEKI